MARKPKKSLRYPYFPERIPWGLEFGLSYPEEVEEGFERGNKDTSGFPGRVPGEPLKEIKGFWAGVCKEAKIEDCRIHDLRHTYASILASAGHSLPVIGALLGHTQPNTTARYSHLFDDPLREATEQVGSVVTDLSAAGT